MATPSFHGAISALFLLSASLLLISSSAESITPHPHNLQSSEIPNPNNPQVAYGCSYTVVFKTSCSSPRLTRDAISLAFGDAYRNEVYAPRLDDPSSRAFERCSTDTYKLAGPCGYGVCYLYLYRQGWDGWVPEWVQVYEPRSGGRPVTFYYGYPVPAGVWYGFNQCPRVAVEKSGSEIEREGGGGGAISEM